MKQAKNQTYRKKEGFKLFLLVAPFLLLCFLFSYLPLYGWVYAFFDYKPPLKLSQCDFVGLKWFTTLFTNQAQVQQLLRVLKNTFAMSFLGIISSVLPMIFAIFLSEMRSKRFKKLVQTTTTLPNFISWVLVYSVAFSLFSNSGMMNTLLQNLNLIQEPIKFMDTNEGTWMKMNLWGIWKSIGWNSIIYIAALSGIDQSLYEAAEVDGAGRFDKIWNVTVPGLLPTFFVLLMLSLANLLSNGLDQYYVFKNAFNKESIEVLDLYVYNISFEGRTPSLGTALSMMKSLISVTLLAAVNGLSKLLRGESIV